MAQGQQKLQGSLAQELFVGKASQGLPNECTKDRRDDGENASKENKEKTATPFLKWVGGKRSIIEKLKARMPVDFAGYWEPFVGGGALFFDLHSKLKKVQLSDANRDLVTTYGVVQNDVERLIQKLSSYAEQHSKELYYRVRSNHSLQEPVDVAARMIYLNKTCFNGLWRVNRKGEFNVPMGRYANPAINAAENLRLCSAALQGVSIDHRDYRHIAPDASDFVYFDPPYHPVSETASFTSYAKLDFTKQDQLELRDFCLALHERGVKVMVSNSNTPYINELYQHHIFKTSIVHAPRMVNSKASARNAVEEVLITNY